MVQRSHKAHRGTRKSRHVRPQAPLSFPNPAGEREQDSLAGALLAAADAAERVTVPERIPPKPSVAEAVDPLGTTILGHPVVDIAPLPAAQAEPAADVPQADEPKERDDDGLDALDAAFFAQPEVEAQRGKQESFPPVADDILEAKKSEPPSPELLARRSRLRKIVGAVVALAAVVVIGGVGKTLIAGERPHSTLPATASLVAPQPSAAVVTAQPVAVPAAQPVALTAADIAVPAPAPIVAEEPAAPAAEETSQEPAPAVDVPEGVNAKAEALRLLNMGKSKDAVPMAKAAIAADPSDALPYLYLGTALQELGKQKDAIEAYSDCVRNATKGRVWECRAMGGRK